MLLRVLSTLFFSTSSLCSTMGNYSVIKELPYVQESAPLKVTTTLEQRKVLASQLESQNIAHRREKNLDSGNLHITVGGTNGVVLVIKDQAEFVDNWLKIFSVETNRQGLLNYGFEILLLSNDKHGVFILDLKTGDLYKAKVLDANK